MSEPEDADEGKSKVKKIPKMDRPVDKWKWSPFTNPARKDNAVLYHWQKEKEAGETYPFARFNKKAKVIQYTDEEYRKVIEPLVSDWDKLETDVLFELCERFYMRFIVIADRFSYEYGEKLAQVNCTQGGGKARRRDQKAIRKQNTKDRSVDEIKDRYYTVAREILKLRGEVNHPIVKKPFNYEMEVRRKNNLEKIFMRTKDMVEQEKFILV